MKRSSLMELTTVMVVLTSFTLAAVISAGAGVRPTAWAGPSVESSHIRPEASPQSRLQLQPQTQLQSQSQVGSLPTITVGNATIEPDQTTQVNVTLSAAPDGLSGYRINVTLTDGAVANITGATYPSEFALTQSPTITDNNTTIMLKASDLSKEVQSGEANVTLATVNLTGVAPGETSATITPLQVDDDDGDAMNPATLPGEITVLSPLTPTLRVGNATVNPRQPGQVNLTLSAAPGGLSGYQINVTVDNPGTVELTNASYPGTFDLTAPPQGSADNSTIQLKASDLNDTVTPGDKDIRLATVTVNGVTNGNATVTVDVLKMDDDDGDPISPTVHSGTVTVTDLDDESPTAVFQINRSEPIDVAVPVVLNASESTDNNAITGYKWTISGPDSESLTGETIVTRFDQPGTYTVTLTIRDGAGNTNSTTTTITVTDQTAPTARVSVDRTGVTLQDIVEFNASASSDNHEITQYRWDFDGDGTNDTTTTSATVAFSYGQPGTFEATVTVVDGAGHTASATTPPITVRDAQPPTAAFTVNRTMVNVSEAISVDASASSDNVGIASFDWAFGDGSSATGRTAVHTYRRPGNFTVQLLVKDPAGNRDVATKTIRVIDESVIAPFDETQRLLPGQTTPQSLAGKIRVEQSTAADVSIRLLRSTSRNYSLAITAPDTAEDVTVYLQVRAISASQDVENLTMFLDGNRHPFVVNESAGPGRSPWVAFNVPGFSTRTVSFVSTNLSVTSATLSETTITIGETVRINATIENTGSQTESGNITLLINDSAVDTQSVTVGAGNTTTITFDRTFNEVGTFEIAVNDHPAGNLTVVKQTITTTTTVDNPGFDVTVTLAALLMTTLLIRRGTRRQNN